MSEPDLPTASRRPRPIRVGRDEPGPRRVPAGGSLPDKHAFLAALGQALVAASVTCLHLVVFRARGRPVPLSQWSEPPLPSPWDVQDGVERALLDTDPTLVVTRLAGDVVGFSATPRDLADAEKLGGELAAGMIRVLGRPDPAVAVSPRLGLAIVDGVDGDPRHLAAAVAEAVEAAGRTLDQTTADSPYLVHNSYLREHERRQLRIGADLPGALAQKQVTLEFQPRLACRADGSAAVGGGLEVVPCWDHHELGPIPRRELVVASEATGHLVLLGREVRADGLALARRWTAEGTLGDQRLWFDLSPIELLDEGFIDEVAHLVAGAPEVAIGFELPDGRLLDDPVVAPSIDRLEALGVALGLDGVRLATLSAARLQNLPVTLVNLDPELVRVACTDRASRDVIRAVCRYAHDRSLTVNACGVTSPRQLTVLVELGVDLAQGPAVSAPLAEADVWPRLDRSVS